MPVTRHEYRQTAPLENADVMVKHWEDLITFGNSERTSGQKIVLHVNDDQRVAFDGLDIRLLRDVHAPISPRCCRNFNTLRVGGSILENILSSQRPVLSSRRGPRATMCLVAAQLVVASNLQVSEDFGFDKQL